MKKRLMIIVCDLMVTALLLGGIYIVNYMIPQQGVRARNMAQITEENKEQETQSGRARRLQKLIDDNSGGMTTTKVLLDSQDWHEKFADKFTDQVIPTVTADTKIMAPLSETA